MIKLAIIGYGNIGRAVEEAVKTAPDMELEGIYHHNDNIDTINAVVAVLCTPTRETPAYAERIIKRGIATVDSFDIHTRINEVRHLLDPQDKANKTVSIIAAGWDPGSDSMVRAILAAIAPQGITYTNFGPGRSMGHTVAAKAIKGVRNALSMTLPAGKGKHNRHVYIELEDGYRFEDVKAALLKDDYFAHDLTEVELVESVEALNTTAHGVHLERNGVLAGHDNQQFDFSMRIDNPSLTGQVLLACARAAYRMRNRGQFGVYTMIELAPIDLLEGEKEELIKALV